MTLCSSHNIQETKRKVDTSRGASLSPEYSVCKAPLLAEQFSLQKPKGEVQVLHAEGEENQFLRFLRFLRSSEIGFYLGQ